MNSQFLYVTTNSLLHRLHPVTKIIGLVLLFVPAMAFNQPVAQVAVLVLALLLLTVARSLANLRRMYKFLVLLFCMSTLMWALFLRDLPDEVRLLAALGPIQISDVSLQYGVAMGLRITALLIFGLVFISTTKPEDFTYGLRRIGVPVIASVALALAFRLVPTFMQTMRTVIAAQRARGLKLNEGGLRQRLRRYVHLIVPIMGYALRRADDLSRALEARGLSAVGRRTEYFSPKAGWTDGAALVGIIVLAAACIYLRLQGYGELLPRL